MSDPGEYARSLAEVFRENAAYFDNAGRVLAGADVSVDIPINGRSMGATLADGAMARVSLQAGGSCAGGDVVLFRQGGTVVAHRVVRRTAGYLMTRGDARIAPDPPVPLERVIGRVEGTVRGDGVSPLAVPSRSWFVRLIDLPVIWTMFLTLVLSPALAASFSRFLTFVERWSLRAWMLAARKTHTLRRWT